MDRVNGADTTDIGGGLRGFRAEDLPSGVAGTEVTALWLNMVQEEIIKVISAAGLALNPGDWTQLYQALRILGFSSANRRWSAVNSMTLSSAPGAPTIGDTFLIPAGATGIWAANIGKLAEWNGVAWSYVTPPDGHGISLPDGRVYERIAGAYVEKIALDAQSGKWTFCAAAGTANALTGTLSPALAPASYTGGLGLNVVIATTNTGAATFNGKAIVNNNGGALIGGELVAGNIASMIFDGVSFRLVGTSRGRLINTQVFNVAGTFTYTPTPGTQYVEVEVVGGGGAGGGSPATPAGTNSAAGSGGSGAYSRKLIASLFAGVTITVGAAGVGSNGGGGGNGGASSFGSHVAANGGNGGSTAGPAGTSANFFAAGGTAAGAGTSGDLNFNGISGVGTLVIASQGTNPTETPSVFAGGPGSGGPGNSSPPSTGAKTGQNGKAGIVIVKEFA